MTTNEMKEAINNYCIKRKSCDNCPLCKTGDGWCYEYGDGEEEKLKEHYEILFGSESNNVNHPKHYQGKHECIDEMIAMFGVEAVKHFCMCNVYKYRFRASAKNGQEDLDKADWYMDKLMELEKGGSNGK